MLQCNQLLASTGVPAIALSLIGRRAVGTTDPQLYAGCTFSVLHRFTPPTNKLGAVFSLTIGFYMKGRY